MEPMQPTGRNIHQEIAQMSSFGAVFEIRPRIYHKYFPMNKTFLVSLYCLMLISCSTAQNNGVPVFPSKSLEVNTQVVTGAERMDLYLPSLKGKKTGIVANQTSQISGVHLVDTLLHRGISVQKVFAPEHGFRGDAGAGEHIKDGKDPKTGIPLISLYGKNKKPTSEMLSGLEVVVFDIQDVGARFYTYISTMHYVMEACAEAKIPVLILDRPNPNGFYIDGPVLDLKYQSFVGMHPIPVVHGCTVGELAQMINGEGWLKGGVKCDLTVIPCEKYTHNDLYNLPVAPSPNLPTMSSVYLYPSLCWFEGTVVSVGRGTDLPFQVIGYPGNTTGRFEFTPKDIPGVAMDPQHEGKVCKGHHLKEFGDFYITSSKEIYLEWICGLYENAPDKAAFFTNTKHFDQLAGTDNFRKQLQAGTPVSDIRKSWVADIQSYKLIRKKYLLYPDFE
jgi:uncharacterized protein YbbC (DUF1343 family)